MLKCSKKLVMVNPNINSDGIKSKISKFQIKFLYGINLRKLKNFFFLTIHLYQKYLYITLK